MKKLSLLIYVLILIALVGCAVFLMVAPDTIPIHYNLKGQTDGWGSKYTALIFLGLMLLCGGFGVIGAKYAQKKQDTQLAKTILWVGLSISFITACVGASFCLKALTNVPLLPLDAPENRDPILLSWIGALFIILCPIMARVGRNPVLGVRTSWSLSSDEVWKKTQTFSAYLGSACGVVIILLAMLVEASWAYTIMIALLLIWLIVSIAASYYFYKQKNAQE